jgi:hypothetical protein
VQDGHFSPFRARLLNCPTGGSGVHHVRQDRASERDMAAATTLGSRIELPLRGQIRWAGITPSWRPGARQRTAAPGDGAGAPEFISLTSAAM